MHLESPGSNSWHSNSNKEKEDDALPASTGVPASVVISDACHKGTKAALQTQEKFHPSPRSSVCTVTTSKQTHDMPAILAASHPLSEVLHTQAKFQPSAGARVCSVFASKHLMQTHGMVVSAAASHPLYVKSSTAAKFFSPLPVMSQATTCQ